MSALCLPREVHKTHGKQARNSAEGTGAEPKLLQNRRGRIRQVIWRRMITTVLLPYGELRNVGDILSQYLYSTCFTFITRL